MSKSRGTVIDVNGYKPTTSLPLPGRIAEFLNTWADRFPKQHVPFNIIAKAVFEYAHTPRAGAEDAERVRKVMGRVRQILMKNYGKTLDPLKGFGVRACVDSTDIMEKSLTTSARKIERDAKRHQQIIDLINEKEVPSSHYLKPWLKANIADVSKQLDAMTAKILPPAAPEAVPVQPLKTGTK